ncbi:adenylate kinase 8 [Cylas formicarius]|uniref:adenylate kinase 8 n=1 Tax=Cylas formicarius TaxID=197179 RepID=UPI0029583714|nr:adenylate kinase 8 [Cylas formicarius]
MTNPTRRPLNFPNSYIPYLEKHRILELLYEIARELVIQKPEDHVLFMKQILQNAAASRDCPRVILLGSSKINRVKLAKEIAKRTRQYVITSKDIEQSFGGSKSKAITYLLRTKNLGASGWILADCITEESEARALVKLGVLPTHVLYIVSPSDPDITDLLYCNVASNWPEFRRNLFGLRNLYQKTFNEVLVGSKPFDSVVEECVSVLKNRRPLKRVVPRLIILGPRGSGRKTQAKMLADSMGLVHIDFEYVLCQAWRADTELGASLRKCKSQVCFHSELLSQIINKRVLKEDCLKGGWVLTEYPYTDTDFKFLDLLDTPPNRVVILDCDINVCKQRIASSQDNKQSQDAAKLLQAEFDFYLEHYGSLRKYCGDSAIIIKGNQSVRCVNEAIRAYILGANPTGPPRKGFTEDIPEVCSCDCVDVPAPVIEAYI